MKVEKTQLLSEILASALCTLIEGATGVRSLATQLCENAIDPHLLTNAQLNILNRGSKITCDQNVALPFISLIPIPTEAGTRSKGKLPNVQFSLPFNFPSKALH